MDASERESMEPLAKRTFSADPAQQCGDLDNPGGTVPPMPTLQSCSYQSQFIVRSNGFVTYNGSNGGCKQMEVDGCNTMTSRHPTAAGVNHGSSIGHWQSLQSDGGHSRSNGRRMKCGLYMPTYGGFQNLSGEIRAVTLEKNASVPLGISTCACAEQNGSCSDTGDARILISDIKPHSLAAANRSLQRGMQILSINHTTVRNLDQQSVDHLLHDAYYKSAGRHIELVVHLV
eukprot:scpid78539/ scgid19791/ 